ncbi:MAG: class F420-dependent oxidoreductase [Subtercola sp.]|nr:class F420-dependent oxidoreductase [Subtercola sp.]
MNNTRFDDTDAFLTSMEEYAALGIDLITTSPKAPDPAGWTAEVTAAVVPRLAAL